MAGDRAPSHGAKQLAPPPGEGSRFDVFERETLRSLNRALGDILTLGREGNRILGKLADILGAMHENAIQIKHLTEISTTENQLTRAAICDLADEIRLLRGGKVKPREETTAVRSRPVRKVAG